MPRFREGYRQLPVQVPVVVYDALVADASYKRESLARRLTELLRKHYRIPLDQIPPPRRAGYKPKR